MTDAPTMKEKRELIKNTYLAHTHSDEGGRYAKTTPNNVIGSSPVSYPKLPASSPWSCDPVPPEPPYGIDISEPPLVGEQWEIGKSLDENFGVQRAIRDGVSSAADSLISASPEEPTPDSEVTRVEEQPTRHSLPLSGRPSMSQRRVSPNNIKRRLV